MKYKNHKKSQISQVFIYILAIFVFAIIILYGYNAIKGFIGRGEETAFIQFKNTLEGEVSRIYTEPGDIIVFNERNPLNVPGSYKTICFVDSRAEEIHAQDQIIKEAIKAGIHNTTENVFLIPPAQSPIYLGYIETSPDYVLCINLTKARLDIMIEGMGYGTRISEIP